ncbi:MAG: class I SAM-dependent methyltransferase [Acidimicrobiia bacterium]
MAASDPYRRIAPVYDSLLDPMQVGVRRVSRQVLVPQKGWQVLDVGCGTGASLAEYLEAGCRVTGVDVSPAMLDRAESRLGQEADLRLTDGRTLPFDSDSFDLATTSMVLHEVAAAERATVVLEMARVTRPTGRLLLIDFRFGSLRGWRGPVLRGLSGAIERVVGHYSGYRSFKAAGGIPAIVSEAGLQMEREKIVAGGNLAIYVVEPG